MNVNSAIYDFVDRLNREPELRRDFEKEPELVIGGLSVSDAERAALIDGSPPRLAEIGMHPLVLMRYMVARNPSIKQHITLVDYFDDMGVK